MQDIIFRLLHHVTYNGLTENEAKQMHDRNQVEKIMWTIMRAKRDEEIKEITIRMTHVLSEFQNYVKSLPKNIIEILKKGPDDHSIDEIQCEKWIKQQGTQSAKMAAFAIANTVSYKTYEHMLRLIENYVVHLKNKNEEFLLLMAENMSKSDFLFQVIFIQNLIKHDSLKLCQGLVHGEDLRILLLYTPFTIISLDDTIYSGGQTTSRIHNIVSMNEFNESFEANEIEPHLRTHNLSSITTNRLTDMKEMKNFTDDSNCFEITEEPISISDNPIYEEVNVSTEYYTIQVRDNTKKETYNFFLKGSYVDKSLDDECVGYITFEEEKSQFTYDGLPDTELSTKLKEIFHDTENEIENKTKFYMFTVDFDRQNIDDAYINHKFIKQKKVAFGKVINTTYYHNIDWNKIREISFEWMMTQYIGKYQIVRFFASRNAIHLLKTMRARDGDNLQFINVRILNKKIEDTLAEKFELLKENKKFKYLNVLSQEDIIQLLQLTGKEVEELCIKSFHYEILDKNTDYEEEEDQKFKEEEAMRKPPATNMYLQIKIPDLPSTWLFILSRAPIVDAAGKITKNMSIIKNCDVINDIYDFDKRCPKGWYKSISWPTNERQKFTSNFRKLT